MSEIIKYDTLAMKIKYRDARDSIWDAWVHKRKDEILSKYGIEFEQSVLRLSEDINKYREMSTDKMIEGLLRELEAT